MLGINDPEEMTSEKRFQEVAAILAVGYLRMRKRFVHSPGLDSGCLAQSSDKNSNPNSMLWQDKFPAASAV